MHKSAHTQGSPRLATVKREAVRIGLPYTTLRDRCLAGEIQIIRVGRALYVESRDVDRWIESRKGAV